MTLSELANRSTRGLSLMLSGIGLHFLVQAWDAFLPDGSAARGLIAVLIVMAVIMAVTGAVIYLRAASGSGREQRATLKADEWQQRIGHKATGMAFTLVILLLALLEALPARALPDAETVVRIVFGTAMLATGVTLFALDRASQ